MQNSSHFLPKETFLLGESGEKRRKNEEKRKRRGEGGNPRLYFLEIKFRSKTSPCVHPSIPIDCKSRNNRSKRPRGKSARSLKAKIFVRVSVKSSPRALPNYNSACTPCTFLPRSTFFSRRIKDFHSTTLVFLSLKSLATSFVQYFLYFCGKKCNCGLRC